MNVDEARAYTRTEQTPRPVASYGEAVERIETLKALDTEDLHPETHLRFMAHGRKTPRAIIFFHGGTNSPAQFAELGAMLFERGYNVFIPRAPYHGLRDRLTVEQARLTREDLVAYATEAVDVGRGLGEQLIVGGLSMGAILSGWCAHHRPEVDRALLIAPGFAPYGVPTSLVAPIARLLLVLPNRFVWWNRDLKERFRLGPRYPWYSTHAMAEVFLLADEVRRMAGRLKPLARSIVVVTAATDRSASNRATAGVVQAWRRYPSVKVVAHEFGDERIPNHDMISPYEEGQRTDLVYPTLVELIDLPIG